MINTDQELQKFLDKFPKDDDYCGSHYWRWEEKVLQALKEMGHRHMWFYNIDADSFGPLVRGLRCDGLTASYG